MELYRFPTAGADIRNQIEEVLHPELSTEDLYECVDSEEILRLEEKLRLISQEGMRCAASMLRQYLDDNHYSRSWMFRGWIITVIVIDSYCLVKGLESTPGMKSHSSRRSSPLLSANAQALDSDNFPRLTFDRELSSLMFHDFFQCALDLYFQAPHVQEGPISREEMEECLMSTVRAFASTLTPKHQSATSST